MTPAVGAFAVLDGRYLGRIGKISEHLLLLGPSTADGAKIRGKCLSKAPLIKTSCHSFPSLSTVFNDDLLFPALAIPGHRHTRLVKP